MTLYDFIRPTMNPIADKVYGANVNPEGSHVSWDMLDQNSTKYDFTDMDLTFNNMEFISDELGNHYRIVSQLSLGQYDKQVPVRQLLPDAIDDFSMDSPMIQRYLKLHVAGIILVSKLQESNSTHETMRGIEVVLTANPPANTNDLVNWWTMYAGGHEYAYAAFHPSTGKNMNKVVVDPKPIDVNWGRSLDRNSWSKMSKITRPGKLIAGHPLFFQETFLEGTEHPGDDISTLLIHYKTAAKRSATVSA